MDILIISMSILFYSSINCFDYKSIDQLINLPIKFDDIDYEPFAYNIPITFNEKPNQMLNKAEILFRDELLGPESLALAENGSIYTGTFGGHIWRIDGNMITKIATIENGRPIGIRITSEGVIYTIEPSTGIYRIDQNLNVVKILGLDGNKAKNFEPSKFIDDLVVVEGMGCNGGDVIYYTDVTTKRPLPQFFYTMTEPDTTGRIIKYDITSKKVTVVVKDIWFPNGIEISDDKNALIFCEFTRKRILKHYISGEKKGLTKILIEGLPGEPDNIRRSQSKSETYWIAMAGVRTQANTTLFDKLSSYPSIRKALFKSFYKMGLTIETVGVLTDNKVLASVGSNIKSGHYFYDLNAYPGMAIEIDRKGNIITTLQLPENNNRIGSLSEIREIPSKSSKRTLYLGSYGNSYLGKITF